MSNKDFSELYAETRENHGRLHKMHLSDVNIWFVEQSGRGEAGTVESCVDFGVITCKGSVIITKDHGAYLKINDQYWVMVGRGVGGAMLHDLDIINLLINEGEHVATIIDPGM